ncbi:sulfite exporter TauE/SafE family protein [Crocinitomix catalasitica]|mgnify:CR=1 FL=1|uniref:sulfite exporter TauE/SafE family protein n=1 Tax=Crocinitomix catalasitica TaxID=184607 RepID=UPI000485E161|nr:sulfite exporter TauE/SafE family protein [Crocinitomix catalasitica]
MDFWIYPIAIIGGFLAGFINTLAGNGSAITLTILMEFMGLPPNIANASNRVGIFAQSIVSTSVFQKHGKINWRTSLPFIITVFLGAMVGLYLALTVDNAGFKQVYGFLMILLLFVILFKPSRWINPPEGERKLPLIFLLIGFFLLGIYGGFIQMGMGIIFLAFSVLVGKFDMLSANAMKIICVGSYTGVVLLIFALNGWVNWWAGGLIAVGQIIGAMISSRFASNHPKANIVAHRLLIVVVVFAIVKYYFL